MTHVGRAVVFLAALHASGVARAEDFASMVRDLNAMQNLMAVGNSAARDRAAKQFDLIDMAIETVEPEGWRDERNVRAAIVYLLCGGAATRLREIHEAQFVGGDLAGLLGASVEYADGREGGIPKALMEMNARDVPPVVGGHLALVQGGALIGVDNARATALFDLARLLMPGSLVEEAALRREIAILDPVRETGKLAMLAGRYIAKYAASPYAQNFWEAFRRATVEEKTIVDRPGPFEPLVDKAPTTLRLSFYLALARGALQSGKFDPARKAIDKAAVSATTPAAQKRIDAYRSILVALTEERGGEDLRALEQKRLEKEDAELVALASSVVSRLSARVEPEPRADEAPYEMAETVRRALAQSDELLKRSARP
jgi:chemotaxis protein MotC